MSENFKSFIPFRRDLKTPCMLFAKLEQCGHCHTTAPIMKRVQKELKGIMPIYLIDAETHKKVCDQLKLRAFPEIMFLGKDRIVRKYNGPRDVRHILSFANGHYSMSS
ncbi:protein disulfide isomerase [Paramecium bursaria Chlorella virus NE-JV-1]|nr:protein disulfide isomerase [Paramecium bursaria Chlorella virus NE-JV-1]